MTPTFAIRPFSGKTTSWWYSHRQNIDMDPPYQRRGGLWSREDKAYLIDSILNEFDIPKIYIADFTYVDTSLNQKKKQYAIIDGKQRLEAIFDFFDGKISLNDDFQYTADPIIDVSGLNYKDLKGKFPSIAERFEQQVLDVVSVITNDEARINELFVRLNRNKPLTGAEIRNAMQGQVPGVLRELSDHEFFRNNIRFQTRRGEDRNAAAKLLLIEFRGGFTDVKRTHLDTFVKEATRTMSSDVRGSARRVTLVLSNMAHIFGQGDRLLSSQGQLPVYYWLTRTFFDRHGSDLRPFLVRFEERRKKVQKIERGEAPGNIDSDYSAYTGFNRSVNDVGSLTGRYRILTSKFRAYKRDPASI